MKSIRTLSLLMEVILMVVIMVLLLSLSSVVNQHIFEETTLSLEESVVNLDASITLYLQDRSEAFSQISDFVDSAPSNIVMPTFSDLYLTDLDYKVTRILQVAEQSLIFPGFDQSYSDIGHYLNEYPPEDLVVSPLLESPEFQYPSLFFIEKRSNGYLFGRLSLKDLSGLLEVTAQNLDGIIIIASQEGFILSSTSLDIPFYVLPEKELDEYEGYWITRLNSDALDSELILLTPIENVNRIALTVRKLFPYYIFLLFIVMIGKIFLQDAFMVRPIGHFVNLITSWTVRDALVVPKNLLMNTREFKMLYDQFEDKTTSVNQSFVEIDEARKKAEDAEERLIISENDLRVINEELEVLIEQRSKELSMAYEQLVQQEKMASLGTLVGGVTHEISTPVGTCVTITSFLRNRYEVFNKKYNEGKMTRSEFDKFQEDIDESLKMLTLSIGRASELISSFKQMAVGQSVEVVTKFNLKEQLDMLVLSLKHEYKYKKHYFTIDCPDDIILTSYLGTYIQLFTNLIMNALIHGLGNKDVGEIKILIKDNANDISIDFSDDGKGIAPNELRRIYEPYYTTNREDGGSGLGLFIVYNLVTQKLGGSIKCHSKLGHGTEFHIEVHKEVHKVVK